MVHSTNSSPLSSHHHDDDERDDKNNKTTSLVQPFKKKSVKLHIEKYTQALARYKQGLKKNTEKKVAAPNNNNKLKSSTSLSSLETQLGKNQVVKLNIGGEKYFTTTLTTLKRIPDTFFTGYFNEQFNPQPESTDNAYFIDRPSKHFELILNYLRGINVTKKIQRMNDEDLNEFIEEVVYYQLTPIYDLLPPKGKKQLSTQFGFELETTLKESELLKFDPKYCSSEITLESETRAICNQDSYYSSVLGTISKSFKVKLISNCKDLLIGFAPKSIDVEYDDHYCKCGYYLLCYDGTLFSQNGDFDKRYINSKINNGSIVECLLDKEKGTISYKVDGKSYGVAFSNICSNNGSDDELFPAFDVCGQDGTFELRNN